MVAGLQDVLVELQRRDDFAGSAIVGGVRKLALEKSVALRLLAAARAQQLALTPQGSLQGSLQGTPTPHRRDASPADAGPAEAGEEAASGSAHDPAAVDAAAAVEGDAAEGAVADASASTSTGSARPPPAPLSLTSSPLVGSGGSGAGGSALRAPVPSIVDFLVIRPIAKGAFGRVFLSRKKKTGDLFAIKARAPSSSPTPPSLSLSPPPSPSLPPSPSPSRPPPPSPSHSSHRRPRRHPCRHPCRHRHSCRGAGAAQRQVPRRDRPREARHV